MIIAFKFGMDDRHGDTEEAEQNLNVAEEAVKNLDLQRLVIQDNVSSPPFAPSCLQIMHYQFFSFLCFWAGDLLIYACYANPKAQG